MSDIYAENHQNDPAPADDLIERLNDPHRRLVVSDRQEAAIEIKRARCSELAWKIIAKQNDRWNALPQTEKEAALGGALNAEVASGIEKEDRIKELTSALERCRTVLGNMAMENEAGLPSIFNRWPISHEPLRADAKGLLPVIDAALTSGQRDKEG